VMFLRRDLVVCGLSQYGILNLQAGFYAVFLHGIQILSV